MKTVYVIGAGASAEVGLPVGHKLKAEIAGMLNVRFNEANKQYNGDNHLFLALKKLNASDKKLIGTSEDELQPLCWQVSNSLPLAISIDNYIDNHRDYPAFEVIGKIAILRAISIAEKNSKISSSVGTEGLNANKMPNTWYLGFFQSITENCSFEQVAERLKLITLIVFNYDRCIEYFLIEALKVFYGKNNEEVEKLLTKLTIIHPYGMLAELSSTDSQKGYQFGATLFEDDLVKCSSNIKTFTEGMSDDSLTQNQIHDAILSAKRLVFLGFAFHELNMKLLTPPSKPPTGKVQCFASTYGMSESDKSIVENILHKLYAYDPAAPQGRVKFLSADKTCFDFFNHFRLSLRYT